MNGLCHYQSASKLYWAHMSRILSTSLIFTGVLKFSSKNFWHIVLNFAYLPNYTFAVVLFKFPNANAFVYQLRFLKSKTCTALEKKVSARNFIYLFYIIFFNSGSLLACQPRLFEKCDLKHLNGRTIMWTNLIFSKSNRRYHIISNKNSSISSRKKMP